MVFNNTKVLPAVLVGRRPSRGDDAPAVEISLTLLERLMDGSWSALARPARRLRCGDVIVLEGNGEEPALRVTCKGAEGEVAVAAAEAGQSVEALMAKYGAMPLPPYIAREADSRDFGDYQTVYASVEGAVAAPTAGLHFTPDLLERLSAKGVRAAFVTLHVGAGTFLPMKTERVEDHQIHAERCEISAEAARIVNECRKQRRPRYSCGHYLPEVAGDSSASQRLRCALLRRHASFHKARLPLSGSGPAPYELPPAEVHAVHACLRFLWDSAHEKCLCPRRCGGVPILFIWRCMPASPRGK